MRMRHMLSALSTQRLMTLVLLLCVFVMAARPMTDPDFWWHLRTGQYIWETGSIPRHDIFSHTLPNQPWITHEWLAEVLLYAIYAISGQGALILFFAGVITVAFALVYLQCRGRPYLASFVVVWGAIASAVTWGVRPQMISLLLSAIFLYLLHLYCRGKARYIWSLPPLMVLWANMHGSFFLGLVFPATYILGSTIANLVGLGEEARLDWRDIRRLTTVTVITAAAPALNPNGIRLLVYPFATLGSPAMQRYIVEWFSPDFHLAQFQPFALLILALLASFALSRRAPSPTELIFMLGFGYASLRSARFMPFFVLTVTPVLSDQLLHIWRQTEWSTRYGARRHRPSAASVAVNWALLGLLLVTGAARVGYTLAGNAEAQRDAFPVAAADFLDQSQITGNMYNLYHWGGYLLWRMYPERLVFIDGRADVYGEKLIDEYLQVYQLRETWQNPLNTYHVTIVIIDNGSPLSTMLDQRGDWRRVYADDQAAVFAREEGS
jgi:hypothetical protein